MAAIAERPLVELEARWRETSLKYVTKNTPLAYAGQAAECDERNRKQISRLIFWRNVGKWYQRLVAIANQRVHEREPGDIEHHAVRVRECRASALFESKAALRNHGLTDPDREFLKTLIDKHNAGASAVTGEE